MSIRRILLVGVLVLTVVGFSIPLHGILTPGGSVQRADGGGPIPPPPPIPWAVTTPV